MSFLKDTPVMAQYKEIKSQYPDCLVFFRLGDFYELFFEDAKIASKELDIVLTSRHKNSSHEIPMCGVPFHASENYIARLVKKGFKVAICEQLEDAQTKEGKGPVKRDVIRVVTAGTLLEDNLLEARKNNFLVTLFPEENQYAVACVDISTGDFFIETHSNQGLEEVLFSLNPKEILLPEDAFKEEHLPFWQQWKTCITLLPISRFDEISCEERLQKFFEVQTSKALGTFSPGEVRSAGVLVDYILITQKRHLLKLNRPKRTEKGFILRLDPFTRRNLELFETLSGEKEFSLLTTLDTTLTPFGARLFAWRLNNPICHLETLQQRLDSLEFFLQRLDQRKALQELLKEIPDLERIITRLLARRGSPKDMANVRHALQLFPKIYHILLQEELPKEIKVLSSFLLLYEDLTAKLEKAFVIQVPHSLSEGGFISDGYWPELDGFRHLRQKQEVILEDLQNQYIQETQISSLKIRYNKIIGHYIEVSPSFASKMPFQFTLRQSLVSCLRYTTSELSELAQRLELARTQAILLEQEIFESFLEELAGFHGPLKETLKYLAVLDVSIALADISQDRHYVRPILEESQIFDVQGGRHPVMELAFRKYQKGHFVKNDCFLDSTKALWLMTGPNMAGKSTFLRQNALIGLMAHIGSFVPADYARIGLMDRISSRVGANDNLARGQSTFMVEMVETACILNQATERSFVIFDEVGRGTSTYDGMSLAWACVEHMLDIIKCRTLFATHYHELAKVHDSRPGVSLYTFKIQEWNKQIVFFHEVIPGKADRSYGLHVAKLAGIPSALLQRAQEILTRLEADGVSKDF